MLLPSGDIGESLPLLRGFGSDDTHRIRKIAQSSSEDRPVLCLGLDRLGEPIGVGTGVVGVRVLRCRASCRSLPAELLRCALCGTDDLDGYAVVERDVVHLPPQVSRRLASR